MRGGRRAGRIRQTRERDSQARGRVRRRLDSVRALDVARALAHELDASLAALEVVAYPACVFRAPDAGDNASVREPDAAMPATGSRRSATSKRTVPTVMPPRELARWGDTVDLLVVGSRGYGPAGRLVHGSTSRALVQAARCPVLVLTHSAAVAPDGGGLP